MTASLQGNDEPSARESGVATPTEEGSSSNCQESSSRLETSVSSLRLVDILTEIHDELKMLRKAYHTEHLENTRLELLLQAMEKDHLVRHIELNEALNEMSALAEKHQAEIKEMHSDHEAELERVRNENATYPMPTSPPKVRPPNGMETPEDGLEKEQQGTGSVTPVDPKADDTADWVDVSAVEPNPPDSAQPTGEDDHSTVSSITEYFEKVVEVVDKAISDPYGDRGVYTGFIMQRTWMPHGSGTMQYADIGRRYEGEWQYGRWYGSGKATFTNGDSYKGMYIDDNRDGRGIYKWRDGRVYDGEFEDDERHGKGTFTWPDGSRYDGDFSHGRQDGHGIYRYADGGRYQGGWKDGEFSGFGTCLWADGRKYQGEWRAGKCHGQGVETLRSGRIRHKGQWCNDRPIRG